MKGLSLWVRVKPNSTANCGTGTVGEETTALRSACRGPQRRPPDADPHVRWCGRSRRVSLLSIESPVFTSNFSRCPWCMRRSRRGDDRGCRCHWGLGDAGSVSASCNAWCRYRPARPRRTSASRLMPLVSSLLARSSCSLPPRRSAHRQDRPRASGAAAGVRLGGPRWAEDVARAGLFDGPPALRRTLCRGPAMRPSRTAPTVFAQVGYGTGCRTSSGARSTSAVSTVDWHRLGAGWRPTGMLGRHPRAVRTLL